MNRHEDVAASTELPIFVDGIGPPLSQIEQDYREILTEAEAGYVYGLPHLTCARDVLALAAEVRRLRGRYRASCLRCNGTGRERAKEHTTRVECWGCGGTGRA